MEKYMRPLSMIPIFSNFDKEINRLFSVSGFDSSDNGDWYPQVDVLEEAKQFLIKVDLPGIESKDVSINFDNNTLTIKGERKDNEINKSNFICHERNVGIFCRRILLPNIIDSNKIIAKYKNGVLIIEVPKSEHIVSKKINIQE